MGKPVSTAYTFNGTKSSDSISYLGGQLVLGGSVKSLPPGLTKLTINAGAGDDAIETDAPISQGSIALSYDGGRGIDTLDFSALDSGISIRVNANAGTSWVANLSYSGTPLGQPEFSTLAGVVVGTVSNIENIIGSSGDDRIESVDWQNNILNGGAGDDYVSTLGGKDIVIGGDGEDYLRAYASDLVVGGNWDGDLANLPDPDPTPDTFQNDGIILDFDVDNDRLVIEGAPEQGGTWHPVMWVDALGGEHDAISTYSWRGDQVFTLVGVTMLDVPDIQVTFI